MSEAELIFTALAELSTRNIAQSDQAEGLTELNPNLGWIHYRALMRVNRVEARSFYEIEAVKNNWSGHELERQINSLLFDRLAKSKDKQGLLQLANQGQIITKPVDVLKEPILTVKFVMKMTIRLLGWYYARRKVTRW